MNKLFLFFFLFFCFACAKDKTELLDYTIIDPQSLIDSTSVINVKLETSAESLIDEIETLNILDSSIFILTQNERLLKFSFPEGKFLKQIGAKGRGPSEYLEVGGFSVSEEYNRIVIHDGKRQQIILYDLDGEFIREYSTSGYNIYDDICMLNDSLFALYNSSNTSRVKDNPKIVVFDTIGKIIKKFHYQHMNEGKSNTVASFGEIFYKQGNDYCYILPGTDSLFRINEKGNSFVRSFGLELLVISSCLDKDKLDRLEDSDQFFVRNCAAPLVTSQGYYSLTLVVGYMPLEMTGKLDSKEYNLYRFATPSDSNAWPGLVSPIAVFNNYFISVAEAMEAVNRKDLFPNVKIQDNPILVFYKYKAQI